MGRRQTLLLLLVLCVFTSFVSAQTATVEFLDEWGEVTARVLEQSRVVLRVTDPAANTSPGRDSVAVELSSVHGEDVATAHLSESGEATGIFEGEVFLTTDYALDNIYGVDADQLLTSWIYPGPQMDTATATYGGASDSVEVGLSVTRLVDGDGRGTETVTLGQPVTVRVRDAYADRSAGPDVTTATLTTSGGGSQVVTLTETGSHTRVFVGSGDIAAAAGETVTVTHAEPATGTTFSSDTATVAASSVSIICPRDGRTAGFVLADGPIVARVVDAARNLDPSEIESLTASISLLISGDTETMTLRETGPDTGVFEGWMHHAINFFYRHSGDGLLVSGTNGATYQPDTVRVRYGTAPNLAEVQAPLLSSVTRLVDGEGADAESFALGSDLRIRVETWMGVGYSVDARTVQVRSLATGDIEMVRAWETDPRSALFEGRIAIVPGAAAGDGKLQAQAGEAIEVEHVVEGAASSDQAAVARSAVRFVDEAGLPATVLLEQGTARVRVLDPLSAGQAPPAATIRSRITRDVEPLSLAELPWSPGVFEGSIPMRLWDWSSGTLGTGREYPNLNEPDTVTASDGEAAASLLLAPAFLEVLDAQGKPLTSASVGDTLRLRATAPREDESPSQDSLYLKVTSRESGDVLYIPAAETGGSTGIFEGTVETVLAGGQPSYTALDLEPADSIEVLYDAATYSGDETGRVVAVVAVVPVAVKLLDDQGDATDSYLYGDTLRVRVTAPEANTNPATAQTSTATVTVRRYGDAKLDLETVALAETGPDTGVFTGTLPVVAMPGLSDLPQTGNGLAEFPRSLVEPDNDSLATVTWNGVSATARVRDSKVWFADGQDNEATVFPLGSTIQVWMRRPASNVSPGIDSPAVEVQVARLYGDHETLTLVETGGGTGLFTAALPTQEGTNANADGVLRGQALDAFEAVFVYQYAPMSSALGHLAETPGAPLNQAPQAADDSAATDEDTPVNIAVKANDTDPDGDPLTVGSVIWGAHGSAIIQPDFTITYTPAANFHGADSFTYTVSDGRGGNDTATVSVTVNSVNDPPNAMDDSASTNEDTEVNVAVKSNDTDPDGDSLTVVSATAGTGGSTVILGDGTITYVPNPDFQGTDSFSYTVSDGNATDTATVTISVGAVNDPPNAVDDSATTNEDTIVIVPVLANDVDPDSALTITARTQGTKGVVTILGDGTIRYTPNANANGADSFTYTVSDGSATDTATVFVTITPVNDAPNANNDLVTTAEDTPITIAILANDTDAEGDPLTAGSFSAVANGTLVQNPDGTVTFTPNPDFRGFQNFTYTASDPSGATDTATVFIEITPVNDPPTAVNDAATTNEDTAKNFDVASNDTDPDGDNLVVIAVTQGAKGSVVINNSPSLNGKYVIYTPNANANGSDSFTYTVSDGKGGTSTGSVAMTITPVNDAPDAVADSITINEDTPVTFNPRTNDTDVDGDTLTIMSVSGGTRGTPVLNGDGTITYTPNLNATGTDFIQYNINDGNGLGDSALVTITITAVNDAPDARNDLPLTQEDTPITINVLSNDIDAENNTLTVTALTQPTKGTAALNANNTITYTPNLNTNGSDSFTYTISDGNGGTDTATVSITVSPVNDAPVAVADTATVAEEGTVDIPVRANDTDPENSALTLVSVTQGGNGTVTMVSGQARYQPAANYAGPDTFTYTIRDPGNLTSVGTVTVTVTPVNDPPVANADSAATDEDTPAAVSVLANDTDIDGDTLTVVAVTQSANGSVATDGTTVTFTPAANWSGNATFSYTLRDAGLVERTANVTVTVNPVNDPPLAGADSAVTNENAPVTVSVLANDADIDGGALSVSAVTQGSNGAVTTNGVTVTYTSAAGFSGADSFTYNVSDGLGGTATGLVTITVHHVNGAPVANPDSVSTREGVAAVIAVLANDTDPDGNPLTVTSVASPGVLLPDNTVQYTPGANFTGTVTFGYTIGDGQGGTANGQVTVVVGEALERVALLATNSVALRTGSDVLSGDVIVNQAGAGPFLNGAELSIAGSVTTPANWDVEADSLTVALGAVIGSDVSYNQLTNLGTLNGLQRTPLALPVFPALPAFLTATPGTTTINVATNGTRTLAPGSYLDLVVGRKGTVTFTGGTYHFRSITVDREARLLFSAASQVRVQQKLSTKNTTTIGPAAGAPIDASSIVFYVAGINGTTGALSATPKAVEIGTTNTVAINLYAPNGTIWLQDGTGATGAFLGKDIDVGLNTQVALDSAF